MALSAGGQPDGRSKARRFVAKLLPSAVVIVGNLTGTRVSAAAHADLLHH